MVNAAAPGPVTAAIFCASCFSALLQSEADANVHNRTMKQYMLNRAAEYRRAGRQARYTDFKMRGMPEL
jgi:hypothetical protein